MPLIVKLLILVIVILILILLVYFFMAYCPSSLIACIFRSIFEKDEYDIFLSFKEFIDYYWLNPKAYYFTRDAYERDTTTYVKVKRIADYNDIYIGFKTPIDYYLFYKWKKKLDRDEYHNNRNSKIQKNTRKFVELIQKDIDKLKEQSNKELEQANEIIKEKM